MSAAVRYCSSTSYDSDDSSDSVAAKSITALDESLEAQDIGKLSLDRSRHALISHGDMMLPDTTLIQVLGAVQCAPGTRADDPQEALPMCPVAQVRPPIPIFREVAKLACV